MTVLLVALSALCILIGLIGCVVPGIAGPPFSFLGLILLSISKGWQLFSPGFLVTMAGITVFVTILDVIVPAVGARRFGASRAGFWGAVIGMILGILVFPPFGVIAGAFMGAIAGEWMGGKQTREALRAGWGVFVGVLVGMALKLTVSGILTFYYVKALL